MKTIRTTLLLPATLAATFLLSGCSAWHSTGETQVGDTTIPHKTVDRKSMPIRGSAEAQKASTGKPATTAKPAPAKSGTGSL